MNGRKHAQNNKTLKELSSNTIKNTLVTIDIVENNSYKNRVSTELGKLFSMVFP